MKEKEVDAYLSLASFCQLLLAGAIGALGTEIFADSTRLGVVILATIAMIVFGVLLIGLYSIIFSKLKK